MGALTDAQPSNSRSGKADRAIGAPDLERLARLLSVAGGCERIVNALPVKPPKLIRFVGSQTRALDDAARLIEEHLEPETLIPLLKLGGCKRLTDALLTPLPRASKPTV
jgi:hypothetical protein